MRSIVLTVLVSSGLAIQGGQVQGSSGVTFLADEACPGGMCYRVEIDCAGVETRTALIRHRTPPGLPIGNVILNTGARQTSFYGNDGHANADLNHSRKTVDELVALGYRTFEPIYVDGADPDTDNGGIGDGVTVASDVGYKKIYCTTSEIIKWVDQEFSPSGEPVCATGNSGGGGQIAYALTVYGSDQYLDYAVLSAGPPMARIDDSCFDDEDPWEPALGQFGLYASRWDPIRGTTDEFLGFGRFGGECSAYYDEPTMVLTQRSVYEDNSIVTPAGGETRDHDYPLRVDFLGALEDQPVYAGLRYFNAITSAKGIRFLEDDPRTPSFLEGDPDLGIPPSGADENEEHSVFSTYQGHELITGYLIKGCGGAGELLHTSEEYFPQTTCSRASDGAHCAFGESLRRTIPIESGQYELVLRLKRGGPGNRARVRLLIDGANEGQFVTQNPFETNVALGPVNVNAGMHQLELVGNSLSGQIAVIEHLMVREFRDADADGVTDVDDNCPLDPNPAQENFDGDVLGNICDANDDNDPFDDAFDCRPLDPTLWAAPGESPITLKFLDGETLRWTSLASHSGPATVYDIARSVAGPPGNELDEAICLFENTLPPSLTVADPQLPSPGELFLYVVRGDNPCGTGSYGRGSDGTERITHACG